MYLELAVGQFTSRGPMRAWNMVSMFKGVGLSMNILNSNSNAYYVMVIAYSLYYLVLSFNINLPWEKCDPEWSSQSNNSQQFR
jgi:solute carrier family 6 amino acid transporter-like protein 5/7/9/14